MSHEVLDLLDVAACRDQKARIRMAESVYVHHLESRSIEALSPRTNPGIVPESDRVSVLVCVEETSPPVAGEGAVSEQVPAELGVNRDRTPASPRLWCRELIGGGVPGLHDVEHA